MKGLPDEIYYTSEFRSPPLGYSYSRLVRESREVMLKVFEEYLRNCDVEQRDWKIREYLDFSLKKNTKLQFFDWQADTDFGKA